MMHAQELCFRLRNAAQVSIQGTYDLCVYWPDFPWALETLYTSAAESTPMESQASTHRGRMLLFNGLLGLDVIAA